MLYVNGFLNNIAGSTADASGAPPNSVPLYIGAASINNSPARFFAGSIHDVGIYNRALSADEVMTNFLNTDLNPNVAIPDLIDYKMTDAEAQQTNLYNIVLSDYSTSGEHTGYGVADFAHQGDTNRQYWLWEANNIGLTNALHFNGSNTQLTATNSAAAINFTTNVFTINVWLNPYGYDPKGLLI